MTMQRASSALISELTSARAKRGQGRCGRTRVKFEPEPVRVPIRTAARGPGLCAANRSRSTHFLPSLAPVAADGCAPRPPFAFVGCNTLCPSQD
jgi:hypothetical protein